MGGRFIAGLAVLMLWCGVVVPAEPVSAATVDLIVVGRGLDDAVWYRSHQAGVWSGWTSLGGVATGRPEAVTYPDGRVGLFVRGQDGAVWMNESSDRVTWSGWRSLGGIVEDVSVAVSTRGVFTSYPYDVYVFAKGHDQRAWVRRYSADTGSWSDWKGPSSGTYVGTITASPYLSTAIGYGVGPTHQAIGTFVAPDGTPQSTNTYPGLVGADDIGMVQQQVGARAPDGQLQTFDQIRWTPWGGRITGVPVTGEGEDRLIYARGVDGAVWAVGCCGEGWQNLGGFVLEEPDFEIGTGDGVLAARGRDASLWVRLLPYGGAGYGPWESLGGTLKDRPVVISDHTW